MWSGGGIAESFFAEILKNTNPLYLLKISWENSSVPHSDAFSLIGFFLDRKVQTRKSISDAFNAAAETVRWNSSP